MSIEDDIALLEEVPTFKSLGRDALRVIAIGAETKPVATGEVLITEGDFVVVAYVVEHGSLTLTRRRRKGEVRASVASAGALLGEAALLTNVRRPVTATAREPSSVMRIPRPLFIKMLQGYPEFAERLREDMLRRLQRITADLEPIRTVLAGPEKQE